MKPAEPPAQSAPVEHEPSAEGGPIVAGPEEGQLKPIETETFLRYRPEDVRSRKDVTVSHLYAANLLDAATIFSTHRGQRYEATLHDDGALRFPDERSFPTLSAAAQAVTGGPVNGWKFWKTTRNGRPVTLAALREELLTLEPRPLVGDRLLPERVPGPDAS